MARKIRFGLNMPEKQNIRTLEELKQYFDLKAVLEYYFNNKLTEWFNDRGYASIAEQLNALDREKNDFEENVCKIFGAQYKAESAGAVTAEDVEALVARKEEIRKYTDDVNILENAGNVAFNQAELNALVKDDSSKTVYLLGKEFTLTAKYKNKTYIGLNTPTVKFADVPEVTLEELGIKLTGVKIFGDTIKFAKEAVKSKAKKRRISNGYKVSAAFDFLLSNEQRAKSEKLFNCIEEGLGNYEFNPDIKSKNLLDCIEKGLGDYEFNPDIKSDKLLNVIEDSDLKGYFKNYLDRMA